MEGITEKIKLIGYDALEIQPHYRGKNAKSLRLRARNIEQGKTYNLYIPKDIENTDGSTMESDIYLEIMMEEEPKAFYNGRYNFYFLVIIPIVQRDIQIFLSFSSTTSICHTIVVLPLCTGVAIAHTVPLSLLNR